MTNDNTIDQQDGQSIGSKTMSAGAATAVSQLLKTVVNTAGMMVVARILSPADYGLLGKVAAVTGIVTLLGDLGLSAATIQREKISQEQLSVLFWINVAAGVAIALTIAASGPLLAYFYQDPRVIYVTLGFSLSCVIGSLSPQHIAILKRRLRFDRIAMIEVGGAACSVVAAILAAPHIGYFALLLQMITIKVVMIIGSWICSGWIPGKPRRNSGSMALIKMGTNLTASSFVNYLARNVDNLLIAKIWGEQAVGLYSRAYGLLLLPLQQIGGPMSSVAVPALSRLQSSPERYRAFFKRGCTIAMILQVPLTFFAAIAGREIILVMLGPKWTEAIPMFYALVPALVISSTSPATAWVYLSLGHTNRQFRMTALTSVLIVIGFVVSVPFGPTAVAISFSVVAVGMRVPAITYCFKGTPLRPRDFWTTMISPAIAASIAVATALIAARVINLSAPLASLILKAVVFGIVYAGAMLPTNAGHSFLADFQSYFRSKSAKPITTDA